jgi:hypothetical protein
MMTLTGLTLTNLSIANNESVVQQSIIGFFKSKRSLLFNRFDGDDGVLFDPIKNSNDPNYLSVLFEFKYDTNLLDNHNLAKKLMQSLVYLARMDNSSDLKTPRVVAIVDKDEFVYFHTNQLVEYLSYDVQWPKKATDAYKTLPEIYDSVTKDLLNKKLVPIHHKITKTTLPLIYQGIVDFCKNSIQKRPVTSNKIKKAFDYWEEVVLKTKLSPNDSVNLFVQLFVNPSSNRLNDAKSDGTLITESFGNNKVKVDTTPFNFLMKGFDVSNFSNTEKKKITSTQDTLIKESERRRLGAFYTQDIWAETADIMYNSVFPNYKNNGDCVWDASSGTANITRNREYSNLILTTKESTDVDTILQSGYNSGAIIEQLDALEFTYDTLPEKIKSHIRDVDQIHKIENPPYATSANMGKTSKIGVSNTLVKKLMLNEGLGNASDQLFNQFLYQNYKLSEMTGKKVHIGYFMKPIYFTGEKTKELRKFMGKKYKFKKGFVFNAKEFAGVKSWPLIFAIFECGVPEDSNKFEFDILERRGVDVVKLGVKTFYNTDILQSSKEWLKSNWVEKTDNVIMPPTTNGYDIPEVYNGVKNTVKQNFIGFLHNNANSVQFNGQFVGLYTMPFASSHGVAFNTNGFWEAIMMFNARKLVKLNWLNDKDEYLKPDTNHEKFEVFKNLSLVRCLFSDGSNQTAWISRTYNGISYRIKNEFFPFKKDMINKKIELHPSMATFNDYNNSNERYVAKLMWEDGAYQNLPKIGQSILDEYKKIYINRICDLPNDAWDIGYSQLKKKFPNDFNLLNNLLIQLDEIMRPMVYELGFLLK